MLDLRPVGYIIGLMIAVLGGAMMIAVLADLSAGNPNWQPMLKAAVLTAMTGGLVALACANSVGRSLDIRQSFVLTTFVWIVLPLFGALPFMMGAPGVRFTDAYFEAMSGMTTTGTTVFVGLDDMPPGVLLWRSMLQWLGGLGIVIVALIFLPVMKVGGMQYFRSEAFDTLGKVLPRALDISRALLEVYFALTALCAITYFALGMPAFDAINHAMTTIATGGYSTYDASFAVFSGPLEYAGAAFMVAAGLPFVRYVQLVSGSAMPMMRDVQVRAYLRWTAYAIGAIVAWRMLNEDVALTVALREVTFNVISLFSGTGFGSASVESWGTFPLVVVLVVGLIGACTASTGCSLKVFRYLVLIEAIKAQIARIHSPARVVQVRLDGRPLDDEVINSVIALFTLFLLTFGLTAVTLSLTGLGSRAALTAAWTSVANVGPVFGPEVGPTGAVNGFSDASKWVMIVAMLLGRLELLSVLVLLLPRFWRMA
jgi:trk system potassium uptake protein TrkH